MAKHVANYYILLHSMMGVRVQRPNIQGFWFQKPYP